MTTVGYGDIVPHTDLGKVFAFIVCMWGILITSMSFVSLMSFLKFSVREENCLAIIKNMSIQNNFENSAAKVISKFFKIIVMRKKRQNKVFIEFQKEIFFREILTFKEYKT